MPRKFVAAGLKVMVWALIGGALGAGSAGAQVRQYTPPGGRADEIRDRKKALEDAVAGSRWHLGSVRLDPAFWISEISWVDSPAAGLESDFTARAGAGLRAYLPVGPKSTFAAYALPEYVYWQEREEERRLNQRFGLGSFTYFNRLKLELSARRNEDFGYASSETFQRTTLREDLVEAEIEVPLFKSIAVHARAAQSSWESLAEGDALDAIFSDLNRDDTTWRGGIRYYPSETFYVGAGAGQAESSFDEEADDRSNSGDYWYAELGYERPKIGFEIDYQSNQLEADGDSSFGTFDGWTGHARVEWRPRDTVAARLYGSQALAYSIGFGSAFVDEIYGVGLRTKIGWRLELDAFAETGTHDYQVELGGFGQSDDVDTFGASITCRLGERHAGRAELPQEHDLAFERPARARARGDPRHLLLRPRRRVRLLVLTVL